MSGWNAAMCDDCWVTYNPGRVAVKIKARYAEWETCSNCGLGTNSGIYVRKDPKAQNFPTEEVLTE